MDKLTEESDNAYPTVQPMKGMLYFDSAKGFGEWRILISNRAEDNLREARRQDGEKFISIVKKIRELSNGRFSPDDQNPLTRADISIPIFEAKLTGDIRLVYHIHSDRDFERQVRILGIYTCVELAGMGLFWTAVSKHLSKQQTAYKISLPRPRTDGDTRKEYSPDIDLTDMELENLQSLLVSGKFVNLSQPLLYSMWVGLDVAHVFEVSSKERDIIEHQSSSYVIGRSGTGKTTTMLFKMLSTEWSSKQFLLSSTTESPPTRKCRQLFVTQSRMLADKVEEYFERLLQAMGAATFSPSELKSFAARMKSKDQSEDPEEGEEGEDLVHGDDLDAWKSSLPDRFSLLRDDHFPIFITYDRLCTLIEADIFSSPEEQGNSARIQGHAEELWSIDRAKQHDALFVTYSVFLGSYWSHFPQHLTKGLDPALVFGEFMGVIKGSEQTLDCTGGCLDLQTYKSLSYRSHAAFADRRDQIYNLFEVYSKLKKENRHRDAADRVHLLVGYLREHGVPGQKIDYLYVDEVQDNLLIDSWILRTITKTCDGLFWAGDTAQTIAVGSAFRFKDLKTFQYRVEEKINKERLDHPSVAKPREFQLSVNFRSHAGIVNCAHSVIELLQTFWPYSIDVLEAEEGIVDGKKPIFYTIADGHQNGGTLHFESIFFGESDARIEFGAQQCIIVRDEIAKKTLQQEVGVNGLILTVYESKGLEFDDVLLWNFFQDSTATSSQWRVVLNSVPQGQQDAAAIPCFDDVKHMGICSELKFLYVAVTRSRKHLWIFDNSDRAKPMRAYWASKGRVEICDPFLINLPKAVESSKGEWVKRGENLFHNRKFSTASHAFKRAKLPRHVAVADAYEIRERARLNSTADRAKIFVDAAQAFTECGRVSNERRPKRGNAYLKIAAECWGHSGDNRKAAETFVEVEKYTLAAQCYRQANMFDEMVQVLKEHDVSVDMKVAIRLTDDARYFYFKGGDLGRGLALFKENEDPLKFMEKFIGDLDNTRAIYLERVEKFVDAAELHLSLRHTEEAVRLFKCVLTHMWQRLPLGTLPNNSDASLSKRLEKAVHIRARSLSAGERDEIRMFQDICTGDATKLRELGRNAHNSRNTPVAVLCFDHGFDKVPTIKQTSYQQTAAILQSFLDYIHLLDGARSIKEPHSNISCQKLFGFQSTGESVTFPPQNTFISTYASNWKHKNGFIIPKSAFQEVFDQCLLFRMKDKISKFTGVALMESSVPYYVDLITTRRRHGLDKDPILSSSNEGALKFMKGFSKFDSIRAGFLEKLGKVIEAAELHVTLCHVPDAARLFKCVLTHLWQRIPLGVPYDRSDVTLAQRLKRALHLKTNLLSATEREEIRMFSCICTTDRKELRELGQKFYNSNNIPAALLCFDYVFNKNPVIKATPYKQVTAILRSFLDYIHLLGGIASLQEPHNSDTCQKLFGFWYSSHDRNSIVLPHNTFICQHARGLKENNGFVTLTVAFQEAFPQSLSHRMKLRTARLADAITAELFDPCIDLIMTGRCGRRKFDCRSFHPDRNSSTIQWYNDKIELLMEAFCILQLLTPEDRSSRNRVLISTLYETLNPPVYMLGSHGNMISSYNPYAERGFKAIKDSIRSICRSFAPTPPRKTPYDTGFLTLFMRVATMALAFDGDEASSYLDDSHHRSHCFMKDDSRNSCVTGLFVSSLQARTGNSILEGIKYLEYVFANKITVDVGVICDFMDWLAGLIVLSFHFYHHGSLHHVVLPRTWLLALSRTFNKLSDKNETGATASFMKLAQTLLVQLDQLELEDGGAHLAFQSKSFPGADLHGMYISRTCRSICLLGSNIPDNNIRQQVLSIVGSLSDNARKKCTRYASAKNWDDLRDALLASTTGIDEMICLRHAARQREPVPTSSFLRPFVYWRIEDISPGLTFGPNYSVASEARPAMVESLKGLWEACYAESRSIEWVSTRQEHYFLAPLAYILLYLQDVSDYVYSALEEQPQQEETSAQATYLRAVFEKTIRLKEMLKPTSEIHRKQDLMELGQRALEVNELIDELPLTIQREYRDDLNLAIQTFLLKPVPEMVGPQPG